MILPVLVIPVGDVNPTRRRPYVTVLFILANVAAFIWLQPKGGCAEASFLFRWAAIPQELLSFGALEQQELRSALGPACAATVGDKSVIASAFSSMFLHANLIHLGGNMLYLWVFGNNVEDRLGHARFIVFYLGGGLVATYAFAALNPDTIVPLLGASGAIAAVLGAYLVLYPRAAVMTYTPFPLYLLAAIIPGARVRGWFLFFAIVSLPAWLVLGLWFLLQVLASSNPAAEGGVAYAAHAGGFIAGILLLLVLDTYRKRHGRQPFHPSRRDGPYTIYDR